MKKKYIMLLSFFITGLANHLLAQENILYFNDFVPQHTFSNPAFQPTNRFYFAMPILNLQVSYSNAFRLEDILKNGSGDPEKPYYYDLDKLNKRLKDNNFGRLSTQIDFLNFGLRLGENGYLSFNLSNKMDMIVEYPNVIDDLMLGNWLDESKTPRNVDLSGIGFSAKLYTEFGTAYSRKITEKLTVGARLKLLFGHTAFKTSKSDLSLETTASNGVPDRLLVNVNYEFQESGDYLEYKMNDAKGELDEVTFTSPSSISPYLFNKNKGIAFDFGATYKLMDNLTLSASLIDLGGISWKSEINNFSTNGDYEYNGVNYTNIAGEKDFSAWQSIIDSSNQNINYMTGAKAFKTALTAKMFMGAQYEIFKWLSVNALTRFDIFKGVHPTLSLGASVYIPRASFSLNISRLYTKTTCLGFGFHFCATRFLQFYFVTDAIPARYYQITETSSDGSVTKQPPMPYNFRNLNCRFGINFMVGNKKKKEEKTENKENKETK